MREPAYITIAEDGHLTLFWGDGAEPEKIVLLRGPRATSGRALIQIIEEMKAWAEENGYDVVVPARDLSVPSVDLSIPGHEMRNYHDDEIDEFLDELYRAGGYDEIDLDAR